MTAVAEALVSEPPDQEEVRALPVDPAQATPTWEGTPPLALSTRDWGDAKEGFRYFAALARRALAEGDPAAAKGYAETAAEAASGGAEAAEAKALGVVAGLMEGKADVSVVTGLDRPAPDWRAAEAVRRGMAGAAGGGEVAEALAAVRAWPSPAAAKVVPWLADAAKGHPGILADVTEFARDLGRAGVLGEGALAAVEGLAVRAGKEEVVAEATELMVPEAEPQSGKASLRRMPEEDAAALLAGAGPKEESLVPSTAQGESEIESAAHAISETDSLIESFEERIR